MERLTERHNGVAVIKGKRFKDAVEVLARYEESIENMIPCKVGDEVWCIENGEYSGYLFLAQCGSYVFATARYVGCEDIEEQLEKMCEECEENGLGISVEMFRKSDVFPTREEAEKMMYEREN